MGDHSIRPEGPAELDLVEGRILALSAQVVTAADWLSLMAAAETVLPRAGGKRIQARDLDLVGLQNEPKMRLVAAILNSVASENTYKTNRRYSVQDWAQIATQFAELSLYLLPPARLEFAVELCRDAIAEKSPMRAILLANALSEIDIRVLRQSIPIGVIKSWSDELIEELGDKCSVESIDEESWQPDEYDEWLKESKRLVSVAGKFYRWCVVKEPDDLIRLSALMTTVERPPEPDVSQDEEQEVSQVPAASSYWTFERMFEDL
jgi:hypothetical protein